MPKHSVHARVTVMLEVSTGSWGPECSMYQITKQAKESALGAVHRLTDGNGHVRIIDTPKVVAILATDEA